MKKLIYGVFVLTVLGSCSSKVEQTKGGHYFLFADSKALHQFYQYGSGEVTSIVQGHRGTIKNGLPENSIAAFEYVLAQMPAILEIDPSLTRDSVIMVFHDATLDRTTNGTGRLADYTWAELQELRLKNAKGEVTEYKIPTLAEVLEWARGKTALVLDKKNVPLEMIAAIIREHKANGYVMNMVRSTEDALFYYNEDPERMFSASIRTPETLREYIDAGIPPTQMFACIGTEITDETPAFCELLRAHGMRSLLATASSYDKLPDPEQRAKAYRKIIDAGVTIIESNYPIETGKAIFGEKATH